MSAKQESGKTRAPIWTRQVCNLEELEEALRLVHDKYVRSGYMDPHPTGIRVGAHYAVPTTTSYISQVSDEVVGTVTLFMDSALGLPLDPLYADLADTLRATGRRIGEVGMLADRRDKLERSISILLDLMKFVSSTARGEHLDDLLITVNPKHAKFYQRLLCFKAFGPVRRYEAVGNAPAVLLRISNEDAQTARAKDEKLREVFFCPPQSVENLAGYRMRQEDLPYLFAKRPDVFGQLSDEQIQAIESYYPDADVRRLLEPISI